MTKPRRILHVVASLDEEMGGSARAALDTCHHLVNHGQEATVAATTTPDESHSYIEREYGPVDYRLFQRRFPRHNFRSPALHRWLRANVGTFDVVEIHGVFSFVPLYAGLSCVRAGVPYTVRPHGSLDPFDIRKHRVLKRFYGRLLVRPLLNRAASVVLTSAMESERLETYGSSPRRWVLALPVERPPDPGDGSIFRKEHGIPEDALVVLFLGRIDQKKGLQFLIPSVAQLKKEFPNLWFVLAGDGESGAVAEATSLLRKHGITQWTTLPGFISGHEKQSAFAASNVFALPSLNENLGIAIVEAMHAAVPVLVSDEVYIHAMLAKRDAAIVCRPSVASCTSSLRLLLRDEQLRTAVGHRGQAEATKLFGPEAVVPGLLDLYRRVAPPDTQRAPERLEI